MTIAQTKKLVKDEESRSSLWSKMSLPKLGLIMLAVGAAWRIADVLVFNLGSTWINIMPSKLGPLVILLGLFYIYRREEFDTILGIGPSHFRTHLVIGVLVFLAMYLIVDIGAAMLYAVMIDPSYPLDFYILSIDLLWYSFIFFFINALFEETLFRGLLQNGLGTHFSINQAILISAIMFGCWHVVWPIANGSSAAEAGGILFVSAFLGLFFGIYYERFSSRKTLTGPIVAHTLVNFANENFKVGPDPAVQGPDFSFMEPGLMMVSLILLVATFSLLIVSAWKYKVEDVESFKTRSSKRVLLLMKKSSKRGLNPVQHDKQMYLQFIGGIDYCR
ncbi:MAG: CPBP family intramembrane glutamic endopeptidase [Candidatus Thorarchaeota archaeon]|jgi:membrane protease YdiL (CAAX protease family)